MRADNIALKHGEDTDSNQDVDDLLYMDRTKQKFNRLMTFDIDQYEKKHSMKKSMSNFN